jgi:hypothetical protein
MVARVVGIWFWSTNRDFVKHRKLGSSQWSKFKASGKHAAPKIPEQGRK